MGEKKILLIDDSDAEQFLCKHLIGKHCTNAEIISAANGVQALELLDDDSLHPDYIILDINMPCMTGFEFLDVYEKKFARAKIKIAMFSSTVNKKEIAKALGYECVSYFFEKPLSKEHLSTLTKDHC